GEFFSMLGPSGCGKTTTLRLIAGFEEPTRGRIWLKGEDVTYVPAAKRNVNMVFQAYALFPHMSVVENIAFGLKIKKLGRQEIAQRVSDILRTVRLEGLEDRRPGQLSGGQQQRATPRELYRKPASAFVAGFIGTSNLITLRVNRRDDGLAIMDLGEGERILATDTGEGPSLLVTVRPEWIKVEKDADERSSRV